MDKTNKFTTLFLDRDGVINRHRPDDYVKTISELEFLPGSLEALKMLAPFFTYIFIITNQRGVGKGIMSSQALDKIHAYMLQEIVRHGGRIDRIYSCTDTDKSSPCRKPNPGMAWQAKTDYSDISFAQSIMVGDSRSDLLFARNTGMYSVFIDSKIEKEDINPSLCDAVFPDLYTFAKTYQNIHQA